MKKSKNPKTDTRHLTVVHGFGVAQFKTPTIVIQAKYLETWGFPIGTKIKMTCSKGKLVITPEN